MQPAESLGDYIGRQLGRPSVTLSDAGRSARLVDASHPTDCLSPVETGCERGKVVQYPIYHYELLALALPEMQVDLRRELLDGWAATRWPTLLADMRYESERHCVLHYRLGDFIHLGQVVSPRSVARACAELEPLPNVVEVVGGGSQHGASPEDKAAAGRLLARLTAELRRALGAGCRVLLAPNRPSDVDFARLALAPILVTAGGSFAIGAALASNSSAVRTPAARNTNFPQLAVEPPRIVRPGWSTFVYEMWNETLAHAQR